MNLNHTYFDGELSLPGFEYSIPAADKLSTGLKSVYGNSLNWFIGKYEPDFLVKLLGAKLYTAYIEGISEDEPQQKWTDLDKALYGDIYRCPAANYVWFYFKRWSMTQTTSTGNEVISKPSYSEAVKEADKLCKVWNDMCEMVRELRCGILKSEYEEYTCDIEQFCNINTMGI